MYQASEYRYKSLDDVRELGPPHQRFPHMHPEGPVGQIENDVYLEVRGVSHGLNLHLLWSGMAGVFFFCWLGLPIFGGLTILFQLWGWFPFGLTVLFATITFLTPPPLPMRLNRQSQEMILFIKGHLYRMPWEKVPARIIKSFEIRGAYSNYTLYFGYGNEPEKILGFIGVGGGARYEESALRCWEYYCRYMESGPVLLHKTMEREKTDSRKYWEEFQESPIINTVGLIVVPAAWLASLLWNKSFFKRKWPQEVIDICENHPLLRDGKSE
jgi:hypothetical protein